MIDWHFLLDVVVLVDWTVTPHLGVAVIHDLDGVFGPLNFIVNFIQECFVP
jgi:hypothetical protein